ncbi:hypothetical protein LF361_003588, partial [Acinetobacter baumannii]|nr:hypothetical protein [Acinetobacter baumannii]
KINAYFIQVDELLHDTKNLKDKENFTSLNLILNQEESLEKAEQLKFKIDSLKQSLEQYLNDIEAISNDLKTDLLAGIFSRNAKNAKDVYRETISSLEQSGVSFDDHARLLHEQSELLSILEEIKDYKQQREAIDKNSVHDKFHRTLILSGFCLLKIAKISLNSSFFPKPIIGKGAASGKEEGKFSALLAPRQPDWVASQGCRKSQLRSKAVGLG